MIGTKHTLYRMLAGISAVALAALACTAPGAQQPDVAATVQSVYATITQQANQPRVTSTPAAVTNPATPTQLLPLTATPPDSRGSLIIIHACPNGITIDAKANDWPDSVTAIAIDRVIYNPNGEWVNSDDLSGSVRLCWTDAALFLVVNVIDDIHFQTQRGEDSYRGDEVELMFDFDLRSDFFETTWNSDDTQLSLNPGDFGSLAPAPHRYRPTSSAPGGVQVAARETNRADNYRLEARIAWAELGGPPSSAQNYGLCVAVSDADHPDRPPAEDTLSSHCAGLSVSDPTTWASVTFVTP